MTLSLLTACSGNPFNSSKYHEFTSTATLGSGGGGGDGGGGGGGGGGVGVSSGFTEVLVVRLPVVLFVAVAKCLTLRPCTINVTWLQGFSVAGECLDSLR